MSNLAPRAKSPERLEKETKQKRAGAIAGAIVVPAATHALSVGFIGAGALAGHYYVKNEIDTQEKRLKEIDALSAANPQAQILTSGPDQKSPSPVQTWLGQHKKAVIGAALGAVVVPILGAVIGGIVGHKMDKKDAENKASQPTVIDVPAVNDNPVGQILPSGTENTNLKVPSPIERIINWAERHPRLVAGVSAGLVGGPIAATVAVVAAHVASKTVLQDRHVDAHAQYFDNRAAEAQAANAPQHVVATEQQRALKVRAHKMPTFGLIR